MAKFAVNNHVNASIEIIPFFADNDFYPRTGIELPQAIGTQKTSRRAELLVADKIVKNQEEMASFLQDELAWTQKDHTHWANQNCQSHPKLKVSNMVYVDAKYFSSERDNKLLSMKNAGS